MGNRELTVLDISAFITSTSSGGDGGIDTLMQGVIRAWDEALSKFGFVVIVGHGVPLEVIKTLETDALTFFNLDLDQKMKSCLHQGYGKGGYVPVGIEAVARTTDNVQAPADLVENIAFKYGGQKKDMAIMPEKPSSLISSVQIYWSHMIKLLSVINEISALALGLEHRNYMMRFFTTSNFALRLMFYPPQNDPVLPGQLRYGAHTDYGGFTILKPDEVAEGLQIMDEKGNWMPVNTIKDAFVINTGDMMQRWTNDHWKSNRHRVVNPPPEKASRHRLSMVFFADIDPDTVIEPFEVCCTASNPAKYGPINFHDYLSWKHEQSNIK